MPARLSFYFKNGNQLRKDGGYFYVAKGALTVTYPDETNFFEIRDSGDEDFLMIVSADQIQYFSIESERPEDV